MSENIDNERGKTFTAQKPMTDPTPTPTPEQIAEELRLSQEWLDRNRSNCQCAQCSGARVVIHLAAQLAELDRENDKLADAANADARRAQIAGKRQQQAEAAVASAREKVLDDVISVFLQHHAVTQDQADFANAILGSIRALKSTPPAPAAPTPTQTPAQIAQLIGRLRELHSYCDGWSEYEEYGMAVIGEAADLIEALALAALHVEARGEYGLRRTTLPVNTPAPGADALEPDFEKLASGIRQWCDTADDFYEAQAWIAGELQRMYRIGLTRAQG